MKLYLCDDELKIREEISEVVSNALPEAEVCCFSDGKSLLKQLNREPCDILLLDIDMPELSGMDVAEQLVKLSQKPLLIFVTNHDELVYESFRYHPFGFVRKQFLDKELDKVLKDCMAELKHGSHIKRLTGKAFPVTGVTVAGSHKEGCSLSDFSVVCTLAQLFLQSDCPFLGNQTVDDLKLRR